MTGHRPPRQGRGDPWRGARPGGNSTDRRGSRQPGGLAPGDLAPGDVAPASAGPQSAEVEELEPQAVRRREGSSMRASTVATAVALAALLAAGFGVLGGRPDAVPSPDAHASLVALASPSAAGPIVDPQRPDAPITPAVPCRASTAGPLQVFLLVDGAPAPGSVRTIEPVPSSNRGGGLPTPPVDIPAPATVELRIGGDVCAVGWHIALAFPAKGLLEPVLIQLNPELDPRVASQNRFELPLTQFRDDPGALELQAALDLPEGQLLARWAVRLLPFQRPAPRLIGEGGVNLPTIEGCETVLTFANGWTEDLPDCDQDIASQLPRATRMRPGTRLHLDFGAWVANQLIVICGAASSSGFVTQPRPGCEQRTDGSATFEAPEAGDWTLAMGTCALQRLELPTNRICGTWYARVDTR